MTSTLTALLYLGEFLRMREMVSRGLGVDGAACLTVPIFQGCS